MSVHFHVWQLLPEIYKKLLTEKNKQEILPNLYLNMIQSSLPNDIVIEQLEINLDNQNCPNLELLYTFLSSNYSDSVIYSKNLLYYYFSSNQLPIFFILKLKHTNEIIGCINSVIKNFVYINKLTPIYIVNFLCIHKNYRNSLLALYLILHFVQYCIDNDPNAIWIFNSKKQTDNSFSSLKYYTRPINISKLFKTDYFQLPVKDISILSKLETYFNINKNNIFNLNKCIQSDIYSIVKLLNKFYSNKNIYSLVSNNEISNIISNTDFICFKYVESNKIVAYIDLYLLIKKYNNDNNEKLYVAKLHNFFYPNTWNETTKIKFLNSVIYYLKLNNIDEIIISDNFKDFKNIKYYKYISETKLYITSKIQILNPIQNFIEFF